MPRGASRKRAGVSSGRWLGMIVAWSGGAGLSIRVGSATRDEQSDDELLFWLSSAGCLLPLLASRSEISV